jgi:uncharacterized protein (TIGR02217 family)
VRRNIAKPVEGSVIVYSDGVKIDAKVDYMTGELSLADRSCKNISVDFEFDVQVRFDMDDLQISADIEDLSNLRIAVVEVK